MWLLKGNMRVPRGDGNVPYFDYINVNITVMMFFNIYRDFILN